jgi:hypothetical protein
MDYNNNTYITISHATCDSLGLIGNHRTNNDGTICIIEYNQGAEIPLNVLDNLIDTYTHEEVLLLVSQTEWNITHEA